MHINMNKKYKTKSGDPVRIFTVEANGNNPVVGQVWGETFVRVWRMDGSHYSNESGMSLVETEEKKGS